jgi:hypothetical protein
MTDSLAHYRKILDVDPDATLEEINTAYYLQLEKFPENPTEEEAFLQKLRQAYSVLKRTYTDPKPSKALVDMRILMPVLGVLLVVLSVALVVMNYSTIQMMVTSYEPGDVLRWRSHQEPYGQVLRYEAEHRFHTGRPSGAYEIRLAGKDETVWVSERLVVKGMMPVDSGGTQAAGVGGSGAPGE